MNKYASEREEKILEAIETLITTIKDTDGIKKIKDAITAIISSGTVTVEQPDETKLKGTVAQKEKDRTISDITKVVNVSKYLAPTSLGAGGTATVWTPASGKAIRIKRIQGSVDAKTRIDLRWGTTAFESYFLPADGSFIANLVGCNEQPAIDVSLTVLSSAAATVTASAKGDEI